MNMFKLRSDFPTASTASPLEAVESGCGECKVRSNTSLTHVAKNPALHMASILVHSAKLLSFRIALGCFDPEFLMAVIGESEPGDATVGTLLKCDACTAPAGIEKAIGKLRQ